VTAVVVYVDSRYLIFFFCPFYKFSIKGRICYFSVRNNRKILTQIDGTPLPIHWLLVNFRLGTKPIPILRKNHYPNSILSLPSFLSNHISTSFLHSSVLIRKHLHSISQQISSKNRSKPQRKIGSTQEPMIRSLRTHEGTPIPHLPSSLPPSFPPSLPPSLMMSLTMIYTHLHCVGAADPTSYPTLPGNFPSPLLILSSDHP
jgi:hypothetical protein